MWFKLLWTHKISCLKILISTTCTLYFADSSSFLEHTMTFVVWSFLYNKKAIKTPKKLLTMLWFNSLTAEKNRQRKEKQSCPAANGFFVHFLCTLWHILCTVLMWFFTPIVTSDNGDIFIINSRYLGIALSCSASVSY